MKKLDTSELAPALAGLSQWQLVAQGGAIEREYVLRDFVQTFALMTQIAMLAQQHDHHPEWSNVYNRLQVRWTTHDANGLTQRDIDMAQACDALFNQLVK